MYAQNLSSGRPSTSRARSWSPTEEWPLPMPRLAAAGLAIGSCHSSVGDQDLARELLGFPDDKFCAYMISLGYPADRPLSLIRRPDRRPFDEVVHREHW